MKGFNYPAPTGPYKLTITKGKGWQEHSHCRIQMSLRNERYEGDKLFAVLEWASARFEKITFVLSDTLLRHNLMHELDIPEQEAYLQSKKMGNEWLERNSFIHSFKNINIIRWDEYLNNTSFNKNFSATNNAYNTDCQLNQAVNEVVKNFWSRKKNNFGAYEIFAKQGVQYLLEELTVFGYMFDNKAIDVYAGQWISGCIEALQNIDVIDSYNKAHYAEVDLVRNKAFKELKAA